MFSSFSFFLAFLGGALAKFTEDAELREHLTYKMQTWSGVCFFGGGPSVRLTRDWCLQIKT